METTTTIEEDGSHLFLPDEITTQILLRLSAESVMRCKRVCKTWRALIVDPAFIDIHTRRSISYYTLNPTTAAAETEWIIFPRKIVSHGFDYQLQFVEYNNDNGHHEKINPIKQSKPIIYRPITITHPIINTHHPLPHISTIKKIGSCNGLIFMTTFANNMFVCNPFTREYVDLPLRFNTPRFLMDISRGATRMASGFGYHSSTNEYKVVIIYFCSYSKLGQVAIYTLGSGGWRDKGEISHRVIDGAMRAGGVLFNGALHWLTEKMDEIVSLDLVEEEFRIVPSPTSPISKSQSRSQLGLLGGCLYRSIEDPAGSSIDIWVMDTMEYSSWSKKFSISWKSGLSDHRPLALLESGRILLHCSGERLISYDPETESSIVVDESEFHSVYTYMKTIVSLKELGETDAMIFDPDVCESLYLDIMENRKREAESAERERENRKKSKVVP